MNINVTQRDYSKVLRMDNDSADSARKRFMKEVKDSKMVADNVTMDDVRNRDF